MDQNKEALVQIGLVLTSLTLAFKYTLQAYAKEAGAAKVDEVASVLRSSIRNAEPTPGIPDEVYSRAVTATLTAFDEIVKEIRIAVGPA